MALAETAKLMSELGLVDKLTPGLKKAGGSLDRFDSRLGKVSSGMGKTSAGLARAGTVIAGAAITGLGGAAKAFIDFEDAFQGVVKTVDPEDLADAGLTFDDLRESLRKMAREIPVSVTALSDIAAEAGALGIKAGDIETFTKTVAELSVTTNLTSEEASESLGKVSTILGLTGKDITDFADTLVNLGNNGASTEAEIIEVTKRFAAVGKQAGLSTDQILALSSAATSLGAEPEAAGSALSRIFSNMSTEIANSTSKGKEFAKLTGDSMDELKKRINKGDALGIFEETLKSIAGMSRTEAASALKALGIKNVRDRDTILKMAQNLGFVNDQLETAKNSTGALGKEAQLRFDTIAASFTLLKQNLIDAGISLGSGFAPALGRAAKKLSAFLAVPANRTALEALGKDIGDAIDKIDWRQVLDGAKQLVGILKIALSWAERLWNIFNALPGEIKGAVAGFAVLNKLSGGLIGGGLGDIFGGLGSAVAKSLAASIPFFGKAFVQPVFVTNMGAGLPGAAAGGVPGAAGLGLVAAATALIGVAAAEIGIASILAPDIRRILGVDAATPGGDPTPGQTHTVIDGPVKVNFSTVTQAQERQTAATKAMEAKVGRVGDIIAANLHTADANDPTKNRQSVGDIITKNVADANAAKITTAVENTKGSLKTAIDLKGSQTKAAVDTAKTAIDGAKRATEVGSSGTQAVVRSGTGSVVAAINAIPAPITNVYVSAGSVSTSQKRRKRHGPSSGSGGSSNGAGSAYSGHAGGH